MEMDSVFGDIIGLGVKFSQGQLMFDLLVLIDFKIGDNLFLFERLPL